MWWGTYQVINQCARKMPSFRREAWISSTTSIPTEKGLWKIWLEVFCCGDTISDLPLWAMRHFSSGPDSQLIISIHYLLLLRRLEPLEPYFWPYITCPTRQQGPFLFCPEVLLTHSFSTRKNNPKTHGENELFAQISKKVSRRWKVMDKICKIVILGVSFYKTQATNSPASRLKARSFTIFKQSYECGYSILIHPVINCTMQQAAAWTIYLLWINEISFIECVDLRLI